MRESEIFFKAVLNDVGYLIEVIESDLDKVDVADLPVGILSSDDAESRKTQTNDGRPHHSYFEAVLKPFKEKIRTAVCEKGKYCEVKKKNTNEITLCSVVLDSLVTASVGLPIPAATVSAYCVMSLYLDRLCACGKA